MRHKVEISGPAEKDLEEAYLWIRDDAGVATATEWRLGLYKKVQSVETFPMRFGYAFEHYYSPIELRQALYYSHRIIYTVENDKTVMILHIRHIARKPITKRDIRRHD